MTSIIPTASPQAMAATKPADAPLRKAAMELEAAFLAEMLKSAGLGKSRDSMGGGIGEDQFSTLLVRAQADQMAKTGGIGLAESLFEALKETDNER